MDKAARGAYWELHRHFRSLGAHTLEDFTSHLGELHQEYASDLLRQAFSGRADCVIVDEDEVIAASHSRPAGQKPPFDAALVEGDALVLLEMSTASFTLPALEQGDTARFDSEVAKFTSKARQLQTAVEQVASGTWDVPGLDRTRVRRVFPVLVLLHSYPSWEGKSQSDNGRRFLIGEPGLMLNLFQPLEDKP